MSTYTSMDSSLLSKKRIAEIPKEKEETKTKELIDVQIYFYYSQGIIKYEKINLNVAINSTVYEVIKMAIRDFNALYADSDKPLFFKPQSEYYLVDYQENEENQICKMQSIREIMDGLKCRERIPHSKKVVKLYPRKFNLIYNTQDFMLNFRKNRCKYCSCSIF